MHDFLLVITRYEDRKGDPTVENWVVWVVRGQSTSLETTALDRAHTSPY